MEPSPSVASGSPEPSYCFFLQVHLSDGLLHPTHTPFLISIPQVLQGSQPQIWHIGASLLDPVDVTSVHQAAFSRMNRRAAS